MILVHGHFRRLVVAGLLVTLAACTTTKIEAPEPAVNPNEFGNTNDPAAGFENVQPGTEQDFILNVGRRTFFAENSAALDATARVTLDQQIAFLKKYPQWYAKVQGFADEPGGDAKMRQISQQRADAVMNYLVAGGVPASRLWAKGYGKDRVVRDCADRACKVQNRRVITNLRASREDGD
ncbi:MAG: OmpA family protein [Rhizobiaceae bacterium]